MSRGRLENSGCRFIAKAAEGLSVFLVLLFSSLCYNAFVAFVVLFRIFLFVPLLFAFLLVVKLLALSLPWLLDGLSAGWLSTGWIGADWLGSG